MPEAGRIALLFAWAFLFAVVEVEIEGPDGWAARLPTWYRRTPFYARLYGAFAGGRPLTGYHLFMFVLPLVGFHLQFANGVPWSWREEVRLLCAYLPWAATWDFLWFVLNPAFGWSGMQAERIWWHRGRWLWRLPIDYHVAAALSLGVAGAFSLGAGSLGPLREQIVLVAGLALLAAITTAAAPLYHRWYRLMRRDGSDERAGRRDD